ncbi:LysR substrate-binding domain-containing protein [Pseudovibrio sp. Tun.PSC04-5.I4]|uniref:LysR substrate-binding domain-containing protein n=1 Tax=Pseudovibrio sp. Tun.PSC04-5.I4 TaxID=1798213 RepID=UPI000A51892F|nr:LysR substrate-binding domain-containing protein [Pseudovibrio sp. Tun.PSC04-5.I4]
MNGTVSGQLRIGTLPSLANLWLMERIKSFVVEYPAINIDLVTIPADFSAGHKDPVNWDPSSVDVALTVGRGSWPALGSYPVCAEEMVLVCHPSLVEAKTPDTLQGLLELPRLLHSTRLDSWEQWTDAHHLPSYLTGSASMRFEHFLWCWKQRGKVWAWHSYRPC